MDRVTYVLGAGFSAPLGIPIMRDFYTRSQAMHDLDPGAYPHFTEVFEAIQQLSILKNYYKGNLLHIEEILSIIEMRAFLEGTDLDAKFLQYIADVVKHYTPPFRTTPNSAPSNWHMYAFGSEDPLSYYGWFVANLFNLEIGKFHQDGIVKIWARPAAERRAQYAVITLNYDVVLENVCAFIRDHYGFKGRLEFNRGTLSHPWESPSLAKLHGSVDSGIIVPPTWAKGKARNVVPAWQLAYQTLRESNCIRIIGYSLPAADAYIKYLIKSAVDKATYLKQIDVICRDSRNSIRPSYEAFIEFQDFRFVAADVTDYLKRLRDAVLLKAPAPSEDRALSIQSLEEVHEAFMAARR